MDDGNGGAAGRVRIDPANTLVRRLQENGYHVTLIMPDVDIEDARQRSEDRAQKTGRFVPDQILIPAHQQIPGNFETIARASDEFFLFDTRGGGPGTPPRIKWEGGKERGDVAHDSEWVGNFRSRGGRLGRQFVIAQEKRKRKKGEDERMSKSIQKKKLPLTTTREQMLANLKATAGRDWDAEKYGTKKKYPKGQGATAVVDDPEYRIYK